MACDLEKWRRKLLWERDILALSSEKGGIGFREAYLPSRQVWLEWDDETFPEFWNWVPNHNPLTDDVTNPLRNLNYGSVINDDSFSVSLTSLGWPTTQISSLEEPFSVVFTLSCQVILQGGPLPNVYEQFSIFRKLSPLPTESFRVDSWSGKFNDSPRPGVLPGVTIYPLARCHDCSA